MKNITKTLLPFFALLIASAALAQNGDKYIKWTTEDIPYYVMPQETDPSCLDKKDFSMNLDKGVCVDSERKNKKFFSDIKTFSKRYAILGIMYPLKNGLVQMVELRNLSDNGVSREDYVNMRQWVTKISVGGAQLERKLYSGYTWYTLDYGKGKFLEVEFAPEGITCTLIQQQGRERNELDKFTLEETLGSDGVLPGIKECVRSAAAGDKNFNALFSYIDGMKRQAYDDYKHMFDMTDYIYKQNEASSTFRGLTGEKAEQEWARVLHYINQDYSDKNIASK